MIYAAVNDDRTLIKVGFTTQSWAKRNRHLGMHLLNTAPGDLRAERDLIRRMGDAERGREWFTLTAERLDVIDKWMSDRQAKAA